MNYRRLSCCLTIIASFLVANATMVTGQERKSPSTSGSRIQELQQERVEVLKTALELATNQYVVGASDFGTVYDLQMSLMDAKLAAAQSSQKRISVLRSQLVTAKEMLNLTEARFTQGMITKLDVLKAKSAALITEIELLKEERKQNANQ